MMKCKMEAEKEKAAIEKRRFLMFLIEKKASGAISNEEFKLFKNTEIDFINFYFSMYSIYSKVL